MKHPHQEEWLQFIENALPPDARRNLSDHLGACPECAGRVAAWRRAIRALERLDTPGRPGLAGPRRAVPAPWWSLAAAAILALGFILGHFISPAPRGLDPAGMAVLRDQWRGEMKAGQRLAREELLREVQNARGEDGRVVLALFDRIERERLADYVSLRRDLETLASTADADLNQTRRQLNLLEIAATPSGEKP